MLSKVRDIIQAHGVSGLASKTIAYAYREGVRPFIPTREPVRYAGIRICHDVKWGDRIVPKSWVPGDALAGNQPNYEGTLVAGLKETTKSGDKVVIVGGGVGVTVTVAALRTGPSGTVECFEGSKQHVRFVRQTAARNNVNNVSVHHAVVAKSIAVYGSDSDLGTILTPSQLPECNVLQLDCEGAEVEILRELTIRPRVILVETHGVYGAPTDLVASLLWKRGYIVSHRGEAEPGDHCKKHDIQVLLGINPVWHARLSIP
jgi:Methyltransferase FkbM domain